MEVVKQNCNYSISDTLENGWKLTGSVSKDATGYISINYNVSSELGVEIGTCNYSKMESSDKLNISYNVSEANKAEFIAQSDNIINEVLTSITAE